MIFIAGFQELGLVFVQGYRGLCIANGCIQTDSMFNTMRGVLGSQQYAADTSSIATLNWLYIQL
jgi:hypothetical protein